MTVLQAIDNFNKKKEKIMEAYDKYMKQAIKIEEDIKNLPNKYPNNSKQWIDDKVKILTKRAIVARNGAQEFLSTNLENLQKELDNVKKEVNDWIKKQIEAILKASLGG